MLTVKGHEFQGADESENRYNSFQNMVFFGDPGGGNPCPVLLDAGEFSTLQVRVEVYGRSATWQVVRSRIPFPARLMNHLQYPRLTSQL